MDEEVEEMIGIISLGAWMLAIILMIVTLFISNKKIVYSIWILIIVSFAVALL